MKRLDLSFEIEKIATSGDLVAIGTSKGTITILTLSTFEIIAKWTAHKNQPITGLEFNSSELLFSSGHLAGTNLILWNLHLHQTGMYPHNDFSRRLPRKTRFLAVRMLNML